MSCLTELLCRPEAAKLAYLLNESSTLGMSNEICTEEEMRRQKRVDMANIMTEYVRLSGRDRLHPG